MDKGVIVAATQDVEWLLPWWWYNYSAHNTLPVVFFNFSMSDQAKCWCRDKGTLIDCPVALTLNNKEVDPLLAEKWERVIGSGVWNVRTHWFKKPFAFSKTPFKKTLWIDIDCEVRTCINPIFSYLEDNIELVLTPEPLLVQEGFQALGFTLPTEITYNSGVVCYHKEAPFLHKWKEEVLHRNYLHIGDQEALSRILFQNEIPFKELPAIWNWDRGLGANPEAAIFHWHGQKGKQLIKEQMQAIRELGIAEFSL